MGTKKSNGGKEIAEPKAQARDYDARERASKAGKPNAAAERIDVELRKRIEERRGAACLFKERNDGSRRLVKVNELFFADYFAGTHEGILYEIEEDRLYRYRPESGLWCRQSDGESLIEVQGFMLAESRRDGWEELEARRTMNQGKVIQEYVKGLVGVRSVFAFDPAARRRVLHFQNGVIPIERGRMGEFTPEFRREHYSRNQVPVRFDADARCPRFIEELLAPALPEETREEDMELLSMIFGLGLLGINLPQKIVILVHRRRNNYTLRVLTARVRHAKKCCDQS